jgi:hypothetical protein
LIHSGDFVRQQRGKDVRSQEHRRLAEVQEELSIKRNGQLIFGEQP